MANESGVCRQDLPYPIVSAESTASILNNLVYALYGEVQRTVIGGKIVWTTCDPNLSATVFNIPRLEGEGLMCYFIRALAGGTPSIQGGLANQIVYQTAPNSTGFLSTGVAGQILTSGGPSSPPYWGSVINPIAAALIFG